MKDSCTASSNLDICANIFCPFCVFSPSVFGVELVRLWLKEIKRLCMSVCVCVSLCERTLEAPAGGGHPPLQQDVKECDGSSLYEHHHNLNHISCLLVLHETKQHFPACFQSWGTADKTRGEGLAGGGRLTTPSVWKWSGMFGK